MIGIEWLQAAFLGVVEGVTEFLPISSTGHLILLVDMLHFRGPSGKVFEVVIQLGAILAVMAIYRQRIWQLCRYGWRKGPEQHFIFALILGVVPAIVLGAPLHHYIKEMLYNPLVVGWSLLMGGIIILLVEKYKPAPRIQSSGDITWKTGLLIGCCQTLALIPGVSRSGSTIMGSLLLGVERRAAAEFSFFLAIPTMMLATFYDLYKARGTVSNEGYELIAVGFLIAFLTAYFVVRGLIRFLATHGFAPFAWYRIAVGSLILLLAVAR